MLESAEKMDIHPLDQTCANINRTVGHIRKIIIKISTIIDRKRKIDLKKIYEKELRQKRKIENFRLTALL